jgi:hypothetical protein
VDAIRRHPLWTKLRRPDQMTAIHAGLAERMSPTVTLPDLFRVAFIMVDPGTIAFMVASTASKAPGRGTLPPLHDFPTAQDGEGSNDVATDAGSGAATRPGTSRGKDPRRPASSRPGGVPHGAGIRQTSTASAFPLGSASAASLAAAAPPLRLVQPPPVTSGPPATEPVPGSAAARMLSSQQREELLALFSALDADGSGTVSLAELRAAFSLSSALQGGRGGGVSALGTEDMIAVVAEYDDNHNAELDADEFLRLMAEATMFAHTRDVDGRPEVAGNGHAGVGADAGVGAQTMVGMDGWSVDVAAIATDMAQAVDSEYDDDDDDEGEGDGEEGGEGDEM